VFPLVSVALEAAQYFSNSRSNSSSGCLHCAMKHTAAAAVAATAVTATVDAATALLVL
jgi:hypothetical protein